MARPVIRKGTSNASFRKRIPADVARILRALPREARPRGWGKTEITITLGASDARTISAEHARIAAEVESRFTALRAGPRSLSQKEAVALAGEAYRAFQAAEDEPGRPSFWWDNLLANMKA